MSVSLAGIVGSLRRGSFNHAVYDAAVDLVGDGVELTEVPLRPVPFYDGDLEAEGDPPAVTALKRSVDAADGLIVFSPEYNRSIPAVTKNAIDWLSRRRGESALSRAAVGIVAATPGRHQAAGVRDHLSQSIGANTPHLYRPTLGIGSIETKLTDSRLTDEEARAALARWLEGFVAFVEQRVHG